MGKPSKRRKSDGIQFNIGKRIKVQAQRKFAQGAAVLPQQQTPKETSAVQNDVVKSQTKKMDFIMPSTPKVSTEDFLTFLCFKSSQSLPSHLRVTSFFPPQNVFAPPTDNGMKSLDYNPQLSQTLSSVQGFIPFGVRKQASQFPKKNISRKQSLPTVKNNFNKSKPSRFQGLAAKKASNAIESRQKILAKGNAKVAIAKTIAKKKQNLVLTSNYTISTRRQSYQQKTLRKTITNLSSNSHVSLRNRIISITSLKPDKIKIQESLKKKAEKQEHVKSGKSTTPKSSPEKGNTKQTAVSKASKEELVAEVTKSTNFETSSKVHTPKLSSVNTKSIKVEEGSGNICRTRSSTIRQQKDSTVALKKVITLKTKNNQVNKTPLSSKKSKIEGFEFSSDDDEPLYKKLASDSRSDENETTDPQKDKSEPGAHFTRSKKDKSPPEKQSNNRNISKVEKTIISSRVTRQNVSKNITSSKVVTKFTRSKSLKSNFSASKETISNTKNVNSKAITKKTSSPVKKISEIKKVGSEQQPAQQKAEKTLFSKGADDLNDSPSDKTDAKINVNLKTPSPSELSKPNEVRMEKSFSESDDEPLAAKLIETTKNAILDNKKCVQLKLNRYGADVANSKSLVNGEKSDSLVESVKENKTKIVNVSNNTNPVPSYEESLKIFGIAHRYTDEKLSMTQYVKIKNCNQKIGKDVGIAERKHEFRGNYEIPATLNKNDLKNRPNRKFMKPKEYIEQWLKDSARPFANRAIINSPDFANSDSSNIDKPLKSNEYFDNNIHNIPPKTICETDAQLVPEKNILATKNDVIIKTDENITQYPTKSSNLESGNDELNIYDFESEPELVASPPRKTKLIKEPAKKLDKTRPKYNMSMAPNNVKPGETTQIGDVSSNKVTRSFNGFPIDQNYNENKMTPTESIGNVISTAIIVSLEPNEDPKDPANLIDHIDHDKKVVETKNISNILLDKLKDNTELSYLSSNRPNLHQMESNANFHYNNLQQFQLKPGFVPFVDKNSVNQHYAAELNKQYSTDSLKNLEYMSRINLIANKNFNLQQMDAFRTFREYASATNTTKNFNTSVETNSSNPSFNFVNNLDSNGDLFTLQSKKDFMFNSNIKNIPMENLPKPFEYSKQNSNNIHKINLEDYLKNTNMLNDTLMMNSETPTFKTGAMKEKDTSAVNNDLTQSSSYYSPKSTLSNSSEFEKLPMYGIPHTSTMQLILPKYDHLKGMYTPSSKLNASMLNPNMNRHEKMAAFPPNFECVSKKLYNKSDLYPFVIEKNAYNKDAKVISDENINQSADFPSLEMIGDQKSIAHDNNLVDVNQYGKKVQDNQVTSSPLSHIDNFHGKNSMLNHENKGFGHSNDMKQNLANTCMNTSLFFNKNLPMSADNVTSSFDHKPLKLLNVENKKFTPLSHIKSISIGDTRAGESSISSVSLKNFRLSSGLSNLNKPMPDVKNNLSTNLLTHGNSQGSLKKPDVPPKIKTINDPQTANDDPKKPGINSPKPKESEDHLFYIPLQGMSKTGVDMSNHLIEGVAVKMDTQGPDGPQQRVMMRAKLVRKSQINKNVNKNSDKQTGPIMDMVRSVREAFPEATIHGETSPEAQSKCKKAAKSNTSPAKKPTNSKNAKAAAASAVNCKASSCSSQSSQSTSKRAVSKNHPAETINHVNVTTFPQMEDQARVVEAPVFQPTEKEFQDPLEFIEKISPVAARYGLCRIIPPSSFKSECKISDDMRFTPHNQYLHRMLYRWGPSSREMCAIKKYLATQSVTFKQPPTLSGIEVDLPKLYHVVQNMGGLNKVLEKKMWHRVAEEMCLPVNLHYMDIRLDEIYCKYLLPYDTLSPDERKKLFESVDAEWEKRQKRMVARAANPLNMLNNMETEELEYDITEDIEECITRGKSITLCSYARTAKNNMTMQFGKIQQPTPDEVESKFWNYVTTRDNHVCVSTGSIDSSVWGYGFPNVKCKNSPISKHPWNLKVLTNNSGSILRSLGPIMGVTVPTIHVGMLFSTCCWYRDPHGLPWVEYLHDGAQKIWYGVPDSQSVKFKETLTSIVPGYCQKKTVWLLSDTTMVPPTMLKDHGVSLCRTVQNPGEFILVFPKAFTSSICAGYNVSESVYFAPNSWLDTAQQDFIDIRNSCEPSMFSLERLIVAVSEDIRTPYQVLQKVLPALNKIIQTEKQHREALFNIGLKVSERSQNVFIGKKKVAKRQDEVEECHRCRTSLSLSMLYNDSDKSVFCLMHAAEFLSSNQTLVDKCKLVYTHSIDELERLLSKLIERINVLANKKCSKTK